MVSGALFDLGARLRAAHTGQPVAVAAYAPTLPPVSGIAADVDTDGEHVYLTATDGRSTLTGMDRAGLDALAALGARMDATHRTLIVGTARDLATLTALARAYPDAPAAPVIGWWDERADYPGTEAVHIVTARARLRWVLGVHPDRERETATWTTWLGVPTTGPQALFDLALLTASGATLPGLLHASTLDAASWERYGKRIGAGRRWWARDTRSDAALGLLGRSHATEWFDSIRLDDPLVSVAAAHDGTLVPGTITGTTRANPGTLTIEADRPLSRLRADTKITAWTGEPTDALDTIGISGRVLTSTISPDLRLTIIIGDIPSRARELSPGTRMTLRAERVDPSTQARARGLIAAEYRKGGNWIAGRGNPLTRRGDVPLDIIIAAAGD